ncbi:MAG: polyphenol oxidase family protein [Armatimonadetes bacterium]|nr:polyphenol oxidase family protein [Armatimonadota bacterium]
MTPDLWTHVVTDWPGAVAGITQRGPHNPAIPWSGHNFGYTKEANHAAVDALRHRAMAELAESVGAPASRQGLSVPKASWHAVLAQQVHGSNVAVARHAALPSPYYPDCDALITAEPGLALTLFYADCCPIILYSPDPLCGGVAHAGWRGTVADMPGAVVGALQQEFGAPPEQLQAVVGPCIGVECYEVGPEVLAAVEALRIEGCVRAVTRGRSRPQRDHVDLLALNVALLQRAGVPADHIRPIPHCTRCGPVPLFSWRRDGPTCGRHVAMFLLI